MADRPEQRRRIVLLWGVGLRAFLAILRSHDQDWTSRKSQKSLCHAAKHQPFHAAPPVRAHDDQISRATRCAALQTARYVIVRPFRLDEFLVTCNAGRPKDVARLRQDHSTLAVPHQGLRAGLAVSKQRIQVDHVDRKHRRVRECGDLHRFLRGPLR